MGLKKFELPTNGLTLSVHADILSGNDVFCLEHMDESKYKIAIKLTRDDIMRMSGIARPEVVPYGKCGCPPKED